MSDRIRIAAAQYPIERLVDFDAYRAKLGRWVERAVGEKARLLVFPEYGAMELASALGDEVAGDLSRQIEEIQIFRDDFTSVHADLAKRHGVFILASSFPMRDENGIFRNVALLASPSGAIARQEKLVMTRFERETWAVAAGCGQTVFDTELGRIGIAICYDVEFPLLVRSLAGAGADIVLAPSCTDTLAGYWRVRLGAQARALENQCFVVQSPTVGDAPWSAAVDVNVGAAGVYGPPDRGLPDDGVVSKGMLNRPQWLYADLDLAALRHVRGAGEVLNRRDWGNQPPEGTAKVATLA